MRILLFTQLFQPEPTFKGLPLAKALTARGHSVEVLTGFPNYPGGKVYPGYRIRLWQRETLQGIRVNRVALYPSHDRSGFRRILNYLSFALSALGLGPWLVQRPQIIYIYNLITLMPAAALLKALFGAPVVLDVTDLWPESVIHSGMLGSRLAKRVLKDFCTWMYRCADRITVVTPGYKNVLIMRGVPPKKIEVIYNWCDETALQPATRDAMLARELGLVGRFTVLFAGTMGTVQGLDTVLECAQLCRETAPHILFVLMGGGVDRARLEARAAELRLANVKFLPPQPPTAVGPYLALADTLLVHLKDEPLFRITIPSKTQAYLYMGRPVVMAVRGDAADLVQRAGAGVTCAPEAAQALAETVMRLAALPAAERERMGQAGATFYRRELSMAAGVARLAETMQGMLGAGKA